MSCKFSIDEVVRYQRSRIPPAIYLPLTGFLCTASLVSAWPANTLVWVGNALLAFSLLIQFRLWDDLSDVSQDRIDYPERVLCQANSLTGFRILVVALFLVNLAAVAFLKPVASLTLYLLLNVGFFVWYAIRPRLRLNSALVNSVTLAKYPAFVFLLSVNSNAAVVDHPLVYAMLVTFLCFCVYELLHDRRLAKRKNLYPLLLLELAALGVVSGLMLLDLMQEQHALPGLYAIFMLLGAGACVVLFQYHCRRSAPGRWCYIIFVVGFTWLLTYTFASPANAESGKDHDAFTAELTRLKTSADSSELNTLPNFETEAA